MTKSHIAEVELVEGKLPPAGTEVVSVCGLRRTVRQSEGYLDQEAFCKTCYKLTLKRRPGGFTVWNPDGTPAHRYTPFQVTVTSNTSANTIQITNMYYWNNGRTWVWNGGWNAA